MKNLNSLCIGLAAITLAATGCAKEPLVNEPESNKEGSLMVSLGSLTGSRALVDGLITDNVVEAYEKKIFNATVFVFKEDGKLEAKQEVDDNDTALFQELDSSTAKRIVAVANYKEAGLAASLTNIEVGDDISELDALTVELNTQLVDWSVLDLDNITKGFLMTGEYDSDPNTTGVQPYRLPTSGGRVILPVERVVAKIELGEISFADNLTLIDIANFKMQDAGIQRAIGSSFVYPGSIEGIPASPKYYGAWGSAQGATFSNNADPYGPAFSSGGDLDITGIVNDLLDSNPLLLGSVVDALGGFSGVALDPVLKLLGLGSLGDVLTSGLDVDEIIDLLDLPILGDVLRPVLGNTLGALGFLTDAIVYDTKPFWYVLPNKGTRVGTPENPSTLLTLKGTVGGKLQYYPIVINGVAETGAEEGMIFADGTLIERNTRYIVNIEFRSLYGVPDGDPDNDSGLPDLMVTVVPEEWAGPVYQHVSW